MRREMTSEVWSHGHYLVPRRFSIVAFLRPPDLPFDILDANLISRFLIIIKPFSFRKVDACKLSTRIGADCFPFTLYDVSQAAK